ncbi:MAG: hypothetical protein MJZ72_04480 [Bacteroidales bacterium]|nr:hypothetical protein [Bacteroidales bacterium]
MKLKFIVVVALALMPCLLSGQSIRPGKDFVDSAATMVWTEVNMSWQFPMGDLREMFKMNGAVGTGFTVKTASNWTFGIRGNYCFGAAMRDNSVLDILKDHNGYTYNSDGYSNKKDLDTEIEGRYWYAAAGFGKVFSVSRWKNSGIWLYADFGIAQHKVYLGSQVADYVPLLHNNYKKSLDRRSTGFCMSQSIGYLFIQRVRVASFYVGIEIREMWTKPDRNYIIGVGPTEDMKTKFSGLFSIKAAWLIPLYEKKKVSTFYMY